MNFSRFFYLGETILKIRKSKVKRINLTSLKSTVYKYNKSELHTFVHVYDTVIPIGKITQIFFIFLNRK